MTAPGTFEQALEHHRHGRQAEAEHLYREVLSGNAHHDEALFLLGMIELQSGRAQAAAETLHRATTIAPDNAMYHANLGEAYRQVGRPEEALTAFLSAMTLEPNLAEPVFNLGLLLDEVGVTDAAAACFERAAQLQPNSEAFRARLASAQARLGRQDTAASTKSVLTMLLFAKHLHAMKQSDKALALLERARTLMPKLAGVHNDLGVVYMDLERLDEATASFKRALALQPNFPQPLSNLGSVLAATGLVARGVDVTRESIALARDAQTHSNVLFLMAFDARSTPRAILEQAREFDRIYAQPLAAEIRPHPNDPSPERRLRIGYVSAHFRSHCQSLFTVPLLEHHDHRNFEIFCYSSVVRPDERTQRLAASADHWHNLVGVDDRAAAERIRDDRIDILVDLTMHMAQSRLLVFARKPAPLQVCWLAYPGTTGVGAMDYRVSDPYLDPPESDSEAAYSERTLRLPETFWCYNPLTSEPPVGPLPARANGYLTFGCLNNFAKVTPNVLDLWARVLREVPASRLVLMAPMGECRGRVAKAMGKLGIARERLVFVNRRPLEEYLSTYNEIDVCLDTFPYNGHTTSLDAFWMGVPVVTLVGGTVVGRAGYCQARNLGLPELIARNPDEYVRIAVGLAGDLEKLGALRASLRQHIERSPLMDAPRFARNLEGAYRSIWRTWCNRARD